MNFGSYLRVALFTASSSCCMVQQQEELTSSKTTHTQEPPKQVMGGCLRKPTLTFTAVTKTNLEFRLRVVWDGECLHTLESLNLKGQNK